MKIRILFDGTLVNNEGGVGYVALRLLQELSAYKELELIAYTQKGVKQINGLNEQSNVFVYETTSVLPLFGFKRFYFEQTQLRSLVHHFSPHILHLNTGFGVPLGFNKKKAGTKVILTVHDLIPLTSHWELMSKVELMLYKLSITNSIKLADTVVAISHYTANDITHFFPFVNNVVIIPDGIDPMLRSSKQQENKLFQELCKRAGISQDFIFYLGGFAPRKNILRLIKAYEEFIKSEKNNTQLVISGKLYSKNKDIQANITKIRSYIEERHLEENVIILNYLTPVEKSILFNEAKVFVYPSLYEGFGLPVLEAFSSATPVVTSENTVMQEIGKSYALYANPYNVSDIKDKITIAFKNHDVYKRKAQEAQRNYIKEFEWKTIAKQYVEEYKKLL
jgi:glycosyltransferase involved in cell wall biosynthesis